MNVFVIAWRYLWARPFVTLLTLTSVALGVALISAVLTIREETETTFVDESGIFDLVIGAKGSPLQLVLSSVYHLDVPTGNIPYERFQAMMQDDRVRLAIPMGLGDNYRGFRIVGTDPRFFQLQRRAINPGETDRPIFRFAQGASFDQDFEAVLGADVARQTGLQVGGTFVGTHGLMAIPGSEVHDEFPYTVTGIMEPSGTANDRAIFVALSSVWRVHDAEEELHRRLFRRGETPPDPAEVDPDDDVEAPDWLPGFRTTARTERQVTAVLVQLHTVGMRRWMASEIRNETESMAAIPIEEMLRMYRRFIQPLQSALLSMAYLVVVVSVLGILATLYQSAERRRRELAIMRSLGARASEIFLIVLSEGFLITLLGIAAGWLLGHGGVALAGIYLRDEMGLVINPWTTTATEWRALGLVLGAGAVAGVLPAVLAYFRSPVRDLQSS